MKATYSTDHLLVIDDFLEPEQFDVVSKYIAARRFPGRINFIGKNVRYALNSSIHLTSTGKTLAPDLARETARGRVVQAVPAGNAADLVTNRFSTLAHLFEPVVGKMDDRWFGYTRDFYRSNTGAGLLWHRDTEVYSGAFVFYASAMWDANWGGELCVQPAPLPDLRQLSRAQKIDGLDRGTFFYPKPNRLVFIKGGTPHRVSSVDASAEAPRFTVAGFFLTEAGVRQRQGELMRRYVDAPVFRRLTIDASLRLFRR
ncbi:2OG-Fe(II) oxygenase [Burkholderia sp. FERM BP-3421]|jgi:2OG-Fe(II) oxygenase superfamily|uniref:2OG-Fe(II) oxygenase n=1 Tax=Burkholderia sp. FERM BP-3421 TaxID=1494466 RepID=UPI00235E413D|nr:2OG-Fe(II) oxygenase [Burkholderia sp. FERM BP-3421]WDD92410.1 2OG-Fe(II) oxygenase [Burkholderia sp. FERM BP-3421]